LDNLALACPGCNFKDGKTQSIDQGRLKEKRNMAKTLLHEGMDISFITKVTQLSKEEILKWKVKH